MASTCNSFSSSFRCEVTTLAAIYVAFKESGIMVRSISDLVRMVLELTHEKLEASGKLRPITDYREAIEVLAELRITQRNLSGQNIVRRLQSESLREDGFDLDYLTRVKTIPGLSPNKNPNRPLKRHPLNALCLSNRPLKSWRKSGSATRNFSNKRPSSGNCPSLKIKCNNCLDMGH